MKIFISWSGHRSQAVAEIMHDWLPSVIQAVQPWMSAADIDKGARWSSSIAVELDQTRFGLICLTPENLEAPWILFEAGALSKTIDKTFVCPYLVGVEPADIKGPLVQFQATKAGKQDTKKLVNTINRALGTESLPDEKVDKAFEKWWPDLEKSLSSISIMESTPRTGRSDREILEEILELIRAEARESREFSQTRDNFMSLWLQLLESSLRYDPNVKPETAKALYDLFRTTIQVRQDRPPAPSYTDRGLLWTRQDFEGRNEEEIFGFFEKELMPEAVERARRDWEYVEARDLPNKVMTLAMAKAKAKAEELGLAERWEQWLRGRSPE